MSNLPFLLMQVQKLGGPPLNFFTIAKIWVDFIQLPTLIANISATTQYPKSESQLIETDSSRVQRNKSGELWSTIQKVWNVSLDPPMSTFSGDYISAARGCWSLKFFYTR